MKLSLSILVIFLSVTAFSQSFLNGDFENTSAHQCEFNLANLAYSSKMHHSWAFGSGDEVDIQTFICGYDSPPSNEWFVSLSKDSEGNCDAISMELSENLITGNDYQISYFSSALTGNAELQFGLSADNQQFGDLLFNSLPTLNTWQQTTRTFIAPNSGKYITIRTNCSASESGWDLLDDLQLSPLLGISQSSLENQIKISPNPSSGPITIVTSIDISDVQVFNAVGQLIKKIAVSGQSKIDFNLDTNGIYFVKISVGQQYLTKKLVISN